MSHVPAIFDRDRPRMRRRAPRYGAVTNTLRRTASTASTKYRSDRRPTAQDQRAVPGVKGSERLRRLRWIDFSRKPIPTVGKEFEGEREETRRAMRRKNGEGPWKEVHVVDLFCRLFSVVCRFGPFPSISAYKCSDGLAHSHRGRVEKWKDLTAGLQLPSPSRYVNCGLVRWAY
ncbi:hypothetical protein ZHAS_00021483 [Anopheles sinensis]|uniref:Uncharacterized protein n=1 Tax=Anopheles sinensis TaxID=74873 RepID=A0A084WSI5_ANOSI|nr:hypothetical protein ZHAS_00021483 [Anopheles sinensis]